MVDLHCLEGFSNVWEEGAAIRILIGRLQIRENREQGTGSSTGLGVVVW